MSFNNWRDADQALAAATTTATKKQHELAKKASIEIPANTPKLIAAARLRTALASELDLSPSYNLTDRYEERLNNLRRRSDPLPDPQNDEEAEAWVKYFRLIRRRERLVALKPRPGDIVETRDGELAEISTISHEGRVFFRGGKGFSAWPDLISIVARKEDLSKVAAKARGEAQNSAARRSTTFGWSVVKTQDLSEFSVDSFASADDIEELETIIATAIDERPIQKFLEDNPHLLTSLLGGYRRYCLPQKRLGGEYVPDFLIGDVDSIGIRWVLVELETPQSGIYLKNGVEFDAKTRKGRNQIIEWRNWLTSNIAYARKRKAEDGLGLFDIQPNAPAILLVGRRSRIPYTKDAYRIADRQTSNIQIHSYDWLLETVRGSLHHQGPPASNPYLIHRS